MAELERKLSQGMFYQLHNKLCKFSTSKNLYLYSVLFSFHSYYTISSPQVQIKTERCRNSNAVTCVCSIMVRSATMGYIIDTCGGRSRHSSFSIKYPPRIKMYDCSDGQHDLTIKRAYNRYTVRATIRMRGLREHSSLISKSNHFYVTIESKFFRPYHDDQVAFQCTLVETLCVDALNLPYPILKQVFLLMLFS